MSERSSGPPLLLLDLDLREAPVETLDASIQENAHASVKLPLEIKRQLAQVLRNWIKFEGGPPPSLPLSEAASSSASAHVAKGFGFGFLRGLEAKWSKEDDETEDEDGNGDEGEGERVSVGWLRSGKAVLPTPGPFADRVSGWIRDFRVSSPAARDALVDALILFFEAHVAQTRQGIKDATSKRDPIYEDLVFHAVTRAMSRTSLRTILEALSPILVESAHDPGGATVQDRASFQRLKRTVSRVAAFAYQDDEDES